MDRPAPMRWRTARRLWPLLKDLSKGYKRKLFVATVLVLLGRAAALVPPASTRFLIDTILQHGRRDLLPKYVALVAASIAASALAGLTAERMFGSTAFALVAALRRRSQQHIAQLPVAFYDSTRAGTLTARIMSDPDALRALFTNGVQTAMSSVGTAVLSLLVLLSISARITLLAAFSILAFCWITRLRLRRTKPLMREGAAIAAEVAGRLTESIAGARTVKSYCAEGAEAASFARGLHRIVANSLEILYATSRLNATFAALNGMTFLALIWAGAGGISSARLSIGELMTASLFFGMLVGPTAQLVNTGALVAEASTGIERVLDILDIETETSEPGRTLRIGPIAGRVEFREVTFRYSNSSHGLRGINLTAEPGSMTALVGPSGGSKTTILSLLTGFYKPASGGIFVDGINLDKVCLQTFRSQLGVVAQDVFLFHGTVRENVVFARPAATDAEFQSACKAARVDEFAAELPDGYETIIGERGVKLSGGQRQRISIARAILANPRILRLDEATSNLDVRSESEVHAALSALSENRTTFICAHRLSTIRGADQILFLENGLIVERGTHETLLASRGKYSDLWRIQAQPRAAEREPIQVLEGAIGG